MPSSELKIETTSGHEKNMRLAEIVWVAADLFINGSDVEVRQFHTHLSGNILSQVRNLIVDVLRKGE